MSQEYDGSLKLLFMRSNGVAIQSLLGGRVAEWLNVELPKVENPRVDLLGRREDGRLAHLELQSTNITQMGRREAEYYLDLYRLTGEHVRQVVLYVGAEPLRMSGEWTTPSMHFRFEMIDVRDMDGEALLASDDLGDRMLAILTRADPERVVQTIVPAFELLDPSECANAAAQLLVISQLRGLEQWVLERIHTLMPVLIDITQNKVLGPAFQKGREEGLEEGRHEGEALILRRLLESRFGQLPAALAERLERTSQENLVAMATLVLTASSLDEVFTAGSD